MPKVDVPDIGWVNVARSGPRGDAPIVFLHGVGLDLTWWGAQFAEFSGRRDVVAFDMPGHGRSGRLDRPPTFDLLVDVLDRVIEDSQASTVHLVGLSVGGMIAQTYALTHPTRVRSLSLIATSCEFDAPTRAVLRDRARVARDEGMARIAELSIARWFPPAFRERRPDVLHRAATSVEAQDVQFHGAMWEMISGLDLTSRLPSISIPTLIVVGDQDANAPVAMGEKMTHLIPNAALSILPGVGHFPPVEVPDEFNDLLSAFISGVEVVAE